MASGVLQFAWRCLDCDRWAESPPKWISHNWLLQALTKQGATFEDIPIVADYSDMQPCVVCGAPGEVHHWAPEAMAELFGADWTDWPTSPLCVKHHHLWHQIVTPSLVYHEEPRRK